MAPLVRRLALAFLVATLALALVVAFRALRLESRQVAVGPVPERDVDSRTAIGDLADGVRFYARLIEAFAG